MPDLQISEEEIERLSVEYRYVQSPLSRQLADADSPSLRLLKLMAE
jgi:hypothetical protein